MTVAVACNLSDGVILGVDSAVTVSSSGGVEHVYENAEKLFGLGDRPIGIAAYGLGSIGQRSVGSYLREFEVRDPQKIVSSVSTTMAQIVEGLRRFFMGLYRAQVIPQVETETGKNWRDLTDDQKPVLGLVVGGYGHGAYLSEVWNIVLPTHSRARTAENPFPQGSFGTSWYAMPRPIFRYIKGFDSDLMVEIEGFLTSKLARSLTGLEQTELQQLVRSYEYNILYSAMPLGEGVAHTRFLVELVIGHHRYATGAPVVGGQVRLGKASYLGGPFEILSP